MYDRLTRFICRLSARRPWLCVALAALASVPAVLEVRHISIDTNLKRLLPPRSKAVQWSETLKSATGDGGYFSVLVEGDDHAAVERTLVAIATEIEGLPETKSVEYKNPIEFIEKYRYTLLQEPALQRILDYIDDLQAELNPTIVQLEPAASADAAKSGAELARDRDDEQKMRALVQRYSNLARYTESEDGKVMGMIVRTGAGINNMARLRTYSGQISEIATRHAAAAGLWSGVSGNLRNRVDEYDQIYDDLQRAGTISLIGILGALAISFRSVTILPVLMLPLGVGLLWAYGLVPFLVGELNTITSFLLMVLTGTGVDYAIHVVHRYQGLLAEQRDADGRIDVEVALTETYRSTGRSILVAGLTTSLGLAVLVISDFRGFSDFGAIGGSAMLVILLAVYLVMPATLVIFGRFGVVPPKHPKSVGKSGLLPAAWVAVAMLVVAIAASVLAYRSLAFDYDFTNLAATVEGSQEVKERHRKVYSGVSAPAAIYVAPTLEVVDEASALFEAKREATRAAGGAATIGAVTSIRSLAPTEAQFARRLALVEEVQDLLQGRWVERIKDADQRRMVEDFRNFEPPERPATVAEVPAGMKRALMARDGSGEFIIGVETDGRAKDGRMAMAFTSDLYSLEQSPGLPPGLRGPTGDKAVLAEIMWLVVKDSPLIVGLTALGIVLLVVWDRRALLPSGLVLLPLGTGVGLTFGIMVMLGWKLNFFNMVVVPTMLGVGVDGVHYYRRWLELNRDTAATQRELFEPLALCWVTTVMGYAGMLPAHHPGLRAIGNLAFVGISAVFASSMFLLPGLLRLLEPSRESVTAVVPVVETDGAAS